MYFSILIICSTIANMTNADYLYVSCHCEIKKMLYNVCKTWFIIALFPKICVPF